MNYDNRKTDYEKMLIIKEYCETDIDRRAIIEKFKLRGEGSILEWMRKFVDPNVKRMIDMKGRKIDLPPSWARKRALRTRTSVFAGSLSWQSFVLRPLTS